LFRWRLAPPARQEFGSLPQHARQALAEFLDAAVIVDPLHYQRRPDEPTTPGRLRMLTFGPQDDGLVTFLPTRPTTSCWSSESSGSASKDATRRDRPSYREEQIAADLHGRHSPKRS
jgi:hypothetical protein